MRHFSKLFPASFSLVLIALLTSSAARADSFTGYEVGRSSGSLVTLGLTTSGSITTYNNSLDVYSTFTPGAGTVVSKNLPPLTFDNGSSCSVSFSGLSRIDKATCNGQYSLFTAYNSTDYLSSLYFLSGGVLQQLYYGSVSVLKLNSMGDVAFTGLNYSIDPADVNYFLYNNTSRAAASVTPEPSSLLLMFSGMCCLAFVFWAKRKAVIDL